jgi:hypothetical protein
MEKLPLSLRRRVSLDNVETLLDRFLQFGNFVNDTSNYADFVTELIADLTDRIVVESGALFSLSDDDYRTLNVYLFDTYEPYLSQYYKNAMKDKGLQEEVSRIKEVMGVITEDLDKDIKRRIDFAQMDNLVKELKNEVIDYDGVYTLETMAYALSRKVANELLSEKELRKFDNQQVFDELVKSINDIYGKELKAYFLDQIVKHREELEKKINYVFVKHDKPYYDKWQGFSEGFNSFVSLVSKFGDWVKGVDLDEIKRKLDNIDYYPENTFTGYYESRPVMVLSKYDDLNNSGYYFSIVKRVPEGLMDK